jgi:hypothetical protein
MDQGETRWEKKEAGREHILQYYYSLQLEIPIVPSMVCIPFSDCSTCEEEAKLCGTVLLDAGTHKFCSLFFIELVAEEFCNRTFLPGLSV